MNKKLKKEWIKALRSGKYKQARGKLRVGRAYCCLGVLCKVGGIKIDKTGDRPVGVDSDFRKYQPIWELTDEYQCRELAVKNDRGDTFDKIADYIEANL